MNIEELLNQYKEKNINELNSFYKKTIYDSNNLEFFKKNFYKKISGVRKGFDFMDSFLKKLKTNIAITESNVILNNYKDGEVIIYDYREKMFYTYPNSVVEDIFLDIFLEDYFELDKNGLYVILYNAMLKAKKDLNLNLIKNFMEIGNIVNWFLSNLRDQIIGDYENKFSFNKTLNGIPEIFFEESKEKHQELIISFFSVLLENKVIKKINDFYEFSDIENSIKLIFGNCDLFWFNRPEKKFMLKTNFELDHKFLLKLIDNNIDYSDDFFISEIRFAKKIKTNNIIFGYVISSMFCYLALHTYKFTNSLYSDFLIERYENSLK